MPEWAPIGDGEFFVLDTRDGGSSHDGRCERAHAKLSVDPWLARGSARTGAFPVHRHRGNLACSELVPFGDADVSPQPWPLVYIDALTCDLDVICRAKRASRERAQRSQMLFGRLVRQLRVRRHATDTAEPDRQGSPQRCSSKTNSHVEVVREFSRDLPAYLRQDKAAPEFKTSAAGSYRAGVRSARPRLPPQPCVTIASSYVTVGTDGGRKSKRVAKPPATQGNCKNLPRETATAGRFAGFIARTQQQVLALAS